MFSLRCLDFRALAPRDPSLRALATNAQPQVPADCYSGFDLAPWLGDGARRGGSSRADSVHDNTLHAGLALHATLRFGEVFAHTTDKPAEHAGETAVQAYRDAAHLDDEEFSAIVREMLCGALHLMDARGIDLTAQPSIGLQPWLATMLFSLEQLSRGPWAARLDAECTDFDSLLAAVCDDYANQITPRLTASTSSR